MFPGETEYPLGCSWDTAILPKGQTDRYVGTLRVREIPTHTAPERCWDTDPWSHTDVTQEPGHFGMQSLSPPAKLKDLQTSYASGNSDTTTLPWGSSVFLPRKHPSPTDMQARLWGRAKVAPTNRDMQAGAAHGSAGGRQACWGVHSLLHPFASLFQFPQVFLCLTGSGQCLPFPPRDPCLPPRALALSFLPRAPSP